MQRLQTLVDGTITWLGANLRHFRLPTPAEDHDAEGVFVESRRKALGELAVVLFVAGRFPPLRRRPEFAAALAWLEAQARAPEFGFNLVRRPHLFPLCLTVAMALRACGRPLPGYRFRLQRVLDLGLMDRVERTPWAQIDLRYCLDQMGLRHQMPSPLRLYRLSSAARLPAPEQARPIDVYALTHILFHLGDFGRRDLGALLGSRLQPTREAAALLLGMFVHRRNPDLVGELLIAARCLDHAPAPFHEAAWTFIERSQTPEGEVPDHLFDPGSVQGLPPEQAACARFRANYHPTLVVLLAASIELYQPGHRQPRAP